MLPSTGYFKTINCPFYDSGLCERPYCHFKHPRRGNYTTASEDGGTSVALQSMAAGQGVGTGVSSTDSNTLQHLVSQAVKEVLSADPEATNPDKISENIVSRVVEELQPALVPSALTVPKTLADNVPAASERCSVPVAVGKSSTACVYNPTPIAELKKRHIPVISYMPTRDSRIAIKRKTSPDRIKPWLNVDVPNIRDTSSALPSYSTVKSSEITYKPTAISNNADPTYGATYVPTVKSDSVLAEDAGNSNDATKVIDEYRPKSKKRREEYVPKKLKVPLKTVQQLDDSTLDEFNEEFELIDEILTSEVTTMVEGSTKEHPDSDNVEAKFSDDESVSEELIRQESSAVKNEDAKEDDPDKMVTGDATRKTREKSHSSSRSKDIVEKSRHSRSRDKEKSKERSRSDKEGDSNKERKSKQSSVDKEKSKNRHDHNSKDRRERRSTSSTGSFNDKSNRSSKDKLKSEKKKEESSSSRKNSSRANHDRRESSSSSRDKHRHKSHSSSRRDKLSSSKSERRESRSSRNKTSSSSDRKKKTIDEGSDNEEQDEKENSPSSRPCSSLLSDEVLEISDSDHDIEEECLKIFQEYRLPDHSKETNKEKPKPEQEEPEEVGRKRVAHASASQSSNQFAKHIEPPRKKPNPHLRMTERWRLMRDAAAAAAVDKETADSALEKEPATSSTIAKVNASTTQPDLPQTPLRSEPQMNGNGRLRIGRVPYATSLALAKKRVTEAIGKNVETKTVAQTAKSGARVAHVPVVLPQLLRPEPLHVTTQKFPLNVRQYYVNAMQDICVQIYTSGEDAAQRALREEFACQERCKAVSVYKNSCMLAIHRLRKELDQHGSGDNGVASASGVVSHEAVLAGKSKGSWSVVKTKRAATEIKGAAFYAMLSKWILNEEQLRNNGYPRPHPDGPTGRVKIYVTNTRQPNILSKVPNERFCSRCARPYMVDKHGNAIRQENCIYHWGRKFTMRGESKYSCCQQYGSASGCCDAKTHVWDIVDYENLRGYVKTLPKDDCSSEDDSGVFALDCEMSYTTQGLELTRVTVINEDCSVVYETLVKPAHPIIDYNTRFSGITEEQMEGVTTSLLDVQATLLTMFSNKTILVGHSLESDFKALKLVHDTVVDTSIMFPHRNGYPHKRALRNLCSEYLRKIIQNDVGGHDSNEDAVACMELVLWKVKEEAKLQ